MVAVILNLVDSLDLFTKSTSSKPLVFSESNEDKLTNKYKKVKKMMNEV